MTGIGQDGCAGPAKKSKPAMEKRRRARINASLLELRDLIPETKQRLNKMEKADILEMTVKHLKRLQETNKSLEKNTPSSRSYSLGFNECTQEVSEFFRSSSPLAAELKHNLLNHLRKCAPHNPPDSPSSSPAKATTATTTSELQVATSTVTTNTLRNVSVADSILSRCLLSTFPSTSSNVVKSRVANNSSPRCNILTSERNNVTTPIAVSSTSDDGPGENTEKDAGVSGNSEERSITPLNFTCVKIPPPIKCAEVHNDRSTFLCDNGSQPCTSNANTVKRDLLSAFQEENNNNVLTTDGFNDTNNNVHNDISSIKNAFTNTGNKILTDIVSDRNCLGSNIQCCSDLNRPRSPLRCTITTQTSTLNNTSILSQLAQVETSNEDPEQKVNQNTVSKNQYSHISTPSDQLIRSFRNEHSVCLDNYSNNNNDNDNLSSQSDVYVSKLSLLCKTENGKTKVLVNSDRDALSNLNSFLNDESYVTGNTSCNETKHENVSCMDNMGPCNTLQAETGSITVSNADLDRKSESAPAYLIPIYVQTEETDNYPRSSTHLANHTPVITSQKIRDTEHGEMAFNSSRSHCFLKSSVYDFKKDGRIVQSTTNANVTFDSTNRSSKAKENPSSYIHNDKLSAIPVYESGNSEMILTRSDSGFEDRHPVEFIQTPRHGICQSQTNDEIFEDDFVRPSHPALSSLTIRKTPLAFQFYDEGSSCCNSDDECHESGHSTSDSCRNSVGWVCGYNSYDSDEDDDSLSGPTHAKRSKQCLNDLVSKVNEDPAGVRSRKNSFAKRIGDFRHRKGSLSQKMIFSRPNIRDLSGFQDTPKSFSTFAVPRHQAECLNEKLRFINDLNDRSHPEQFRRRCFSYSQKPIRPLTNRLGLGSDNYSDDRKPFHETNNTSESSSNLKSVDSNSREFLTARRRCASVSAQDLKGKRPLFVRKINEAPSKTEHDLIEEVSQKPRRACENNEFCPTKESGDFDDHSRFRKRCATFSSSPRPYYLFQQTHKTDSLIRPIIIQRNESDSLMTNSHESITSENNESDTNRNHCVDGKEMKDTPSETNLTVVNNYKSRSLYDISEKDKQRIVESSANIFPTHSFSNSSKIYSQSSLKLPNDPIESSAPRPFEQYTGNAFTNNITEKDTCHRQDKSKSCQNMSVFFHPSTNRDQLPLQQEQHDSDSTPLNLSTKSKRYSVHVDGNSIVKKFPLQCSFTLNQRVKEENSLHRPRSWSVSSGMSSLSLGGSNLSVPPRDDDDHVWRPW